MRQPIETKWWPTAYIDEIMPPGRDNASAWIEMIDGAPHLVGESDNDLMKPRPLKDGDLIEFHRCETYDEMILRLGANDHAFEREPPREAEQCCILNGWQADTLSCSTQELIKQLRDGGGEPGDYLAAFYTFVDAGKFRFCADTNTFQGAQ
ncbi:hypothetical protein [Methylocystis iwaonis]|uniref:hypothetical protein n=1 Tax=Methylocystis iwaonis TaxID=2885079 RepID=UPI002E7B36DE|nr:hypothetical protein [Methylocystis iwaonis]